MRSANGSCAILIRCLRGRGVGFAVAVGEGCVGGDGSVGLLDRVVHFSGGDGSVELLDRVVRFSGGDGSVGLLDRVVRFSGTRKGRVGTEGAVGGGVSLSGPWSGS